MDWSIVSKLWQKILQVAGLIGDIIVLVWDWTAGQVSKMFSLPFSSLSGTEQIIYVVVVIALLWMIYRLLTRVLGEFIAVFRAIVAFITGILSKVPDVILVGLVAFGGAWLITALALDFGIPQISKFF